VAFFYADKLKDQKIAAFGSAHRRVGAAEGCDLLIFAFNPR